MQSAPRSSRGISPVLRLLLYATLWLSAAILLLAILLIDAEPAVGPGQLGSQSYLSATRNLLNHRVRTNPFKAGEVRSIALTAEDLTAVANFVLLRKRLEGFALAKIHGKRLDFTASIKIVRFPADLYLNLKAIADDGDPRAFIRQLRIGTLALPKPLVGVLQFLTLKASPLRRYANVVEPLVREVRIVDERLRVTVNWNRDALTPMQPREFDAPTRERLIAYQRKLLESIERYRQKRYIAIGPIMQSLFALALERSNLPDHSAMEENRALILVLGAYANGRNLLKELEEQGTFPPKSLLLRHRIDTAQHFMGSAALAISGHRTFADVIGLAKEINDTHSGSGFSFTDLAADRAGALFGKFATQSPEQASKAQRILSASADEANFMPAIRDLPENLGPDSFAERFGSIDSAAFETLKRDIEERIEACPLYR